MVDPKDLKAVFFDLDGTIFNLAIDYKKVRTLIEEAIGNSVVGLTDVFDDRYPKKDRERALEIIDKNELDGVTSGTPVKGAAEILKGLQARYKLVIISRNARKTIEAVLDKLGVGNVPIISREDVKNQKPDPESLLKAAEIIGVDPAAIILVGDTSHDLEAAHASGIECIILRNPLLDFTPLGAEKYIGSLSELKVLLGKGE